MNCDVHPQWGCPHCRVSASLPPLERPRWEALVKAFKRSDIGTPADALIARAEAIRTAKPFGRSM